jgi:6-phosphogluconolactonase
MNNELLYKKKIFASSGILYQAAVDYIIDRANKDVLLRKRFVIALSGGQTPERLYELFSGSPYRERMPWGKTFIFWGDERCVPLDDERNNAHRAKVILLDKVDLPPENIYRIPVDLTPITAAKAYQKMLKDFFGKEEICFDLILLGLGENGHTASLFPGTRVVHSDKEEINAVYVEEEKMYRITMTAPLINKARHVLFLVTGEKKAGILKNVLSNIYEPDKYPAQLIRPREGYLFWFIDMEAAKQLA